MKHIKVVNHVINGVAHAVKQLELDRSLPDGHMMAAFCWLLLTNDRDVKEVTFRKNVPVKAMELKKDEPRHVGFYISPDVDYIYGIHFPEYVDNFYLGVRDASGRDVVIHQLAGPGAIKDMTFSPPLVNIVPYGAYYVSYTLNPRRVRVEGASFEQATTVRNLSLPYITCGVLSAELREALNVEYGDRYCKTLTPAYVNHQYSYATLHNNHLSLEFGTIVIFTEYLVNMGKVTQKANMEKSVSVITPNKDNDDAACHCCAMCECGKAPDYPS